MCAQRASIGSCWEVSLLIGFLFSVLVLSGGATLAQESTDKANANSPDTVYAVRQDGVTAPKGIYMPNPEYSEKARRKKIQGVVVVEMIVTADGTVRDAKVVKSLEESLDKQAIAAVSTWRFKPATKDGTPVAVRVPAEVSFHIR